MFFLFVSYLDIQFLGFGNEGRGRHVHRVNIGGELQLHQAIEQVTREYLGRTDRSALLLATDENEFYFCAVTDSDKLLRNRSLATTSSRLDLDDFKRIGTFVDQIEYLADSRTSRHLAEIEHRLAEYSPAVRVLAPNDRGAGALRSTGLSGKDTRQSEQKHQNNVYPDPIQRLPFQSAIPAQPAVALLYNRRSIQMNIFKTALFSRRMLRKLASSTFHAENDIIFLDKCTLVHYCIFVQHYR